ncbi:ArpU family phage packaging/lysis transcriptional regulator [Lactiplantibacillus plantarum]|uniref:ArpU family phage packaging/lysis transcriptional regulator n=1 Tax=Lactiplantibacillus plantarum TaxID=1590 RepID=UPI0009789A5F|nr:ArpU family phage packaging/lysis transcriptional regulator [Lactiplantibacillus plantarum]
MVNEEFRNIDENATIEKAKRVLSEYTQWRLKSRRVSFDLQSPVMDGMPKNRSFSNREEEKRTNKSNADFMANTVVDVINGIADISEVTEDYAAILRMVYIKHYSNVRCMRELGLSEKTFYRYRKTALLAFASMYPPVVEKLLVHKTMAGKEGDSVLTWF